MKQVIKSQLFQVIRDFRFWLANFIFLAMIGWSTYENFFIYRNMNLEINGSYVFSQVYLFSMPVIIYTIVMSAYLLGKDIGNKTIYTELSSGITRNQSFYGRIIVTILLTLFVDLVFLYLPGLVITIIYGYGGYIEFWTVCVKLFLFMAILMKLACEIILVVVVTKKISEAYALGFLIYIVGTYTDIFFHMENPYILSVPSVYEFLPFSVWVQYHLARPREITFNNVISMGEYITGIGTAIAIAVVIIIVSRRLFEISDVS